MQFIKINEKCAIYNLLTEFQDVFPHLMDKISNLEDYAEKLSELAYVYSAEKNGESVGILIFYANDEKSRTAYISLIGVKKGYECKGIGKELLDHCEEVSLQNDMLRLKLEVDKDNITAIKFYKKNGFVTLNETERNSFYMQKTFKE